MTVQFWLFAFLAFSAIALLAFDLGRKFERSIRLKGVTKHWVRFDENSIIKIAETNK